MRRRFNSVPSHFPFPFPSRVTALPPRSSWVGLETRSLIDGSEDWESGRSCIKLEYSLGAPENNRSFLTARPAG